MMINPCLLTRKPLEAFVEAFFVLAAVVLRVYVALQRGALRS